MLQFILTFIQIKYMKKIKYIILGMILYYFLFSCTPAGTVENLSSKNNSNIEVYRYYYSDGSCIYVARFKDQPNVVTSTWTEHHGKTSSTKCSVTKN